MLSSLFSSYRLLFLVLALTVVTLGLVKNIENNGPPSTSTSISSNTRKPTSAPPSSTSPTSTSKPTSSSSTSVTSPSSSQASSTSGTISTKNLDTTASPTMTLLSTTSETSPTDSSSTLPTPPITEDTVIDEGNTTVASCPPTNLTNVTTTELPTTEAGFSPSEYPFTSPSNPEGWENDRITLEMQSTETMNESTTEETLTTESSSSTMTSAEETVSSSSYSSIDTTTDFSSTTSPGPESTVTDTTTQSDETPVTTYQTTTIKTTVPTEETSSSDETTVSQETSPSSDTTFSDVSSTNELSSTDFLTSESQPTIEVQDVTEPVTPSTTKSTSELFTESETSSSTTVATSEAITSTETLEESTSAESTIGLPTTESENVSSSLSSTEYPVITLSSTTVPEDQTTEKVFPSSEASSKATTDSSSEASSKATMAAESTPDLSAITLENEPTSFSSTKDAVTTLPSTTVPEDQTTEKVFSTSEATSEATTESSSEALSKATSETTTDKDTSPTTFRSKESSPSSTAPTSVLSSSDPTTVSVGTSASTVQTTHAPGTISTAPSTTRPTTVTPETSSSATPSSQVSSESIFHYSLPVSSTEALTTWDSESPSTERLTSSRSESTVSSEQPTTTTTSPSSQASSLSETEIVTNTLSSTTPSSLITESTSQSEYSSSSLEPVQSTESSTESPTVSVQEASTALEETHADSSTSFIATSTDVSENPTTSDNVKSTIDMDVKYFTITPTKPESIPFMTLKEELSASKATETPEESTPSTSEPQLSSTFIELNIPSSSSPITLLYATTLSAKSSSITSSGSSSVTSPITSTVPETSTLSTKIEFSPELTSSSKRSTQESTTTTTSSASSSDQIPVSSDSTTHFVSSTELDKTSETTSTSSDPQSTPSLSKPTETIDTPSASSTQQQESKTEGSTSSVSKSVQSTIATTDSATSTRAPSSQKSSTDSTSAIPTTITEFTSENSDSLSSEQSTTKQDTTIEMETQNTLTSESSTAQSQPPTSLSSSYETPPTSSVKLSETPTSTIGSSTSLEPETEASSSSSIQSTTTHSFRTLTSESPISSISTEPTETSKPTDPTSSTFGASTSDLSSSSVEIESTEKSKPVDPTSSTFEVSTPDRSSSSISTEPTATSSLTDSTNSPTGASTSDLSSSSSTDKDITETVKPQPPFISTTPDQSNPSTSSSSLSPTSPTSSTISKCTIRCPPGYLIGADHCFRFIRPSSKMNTYQAARSLCTENDRETLISFDKIKNPADLRLLKEGAATLGVDWLYANGIGGRVERFDKNVSIFSIFDQQLILNPIIKQVKLSEVQKNVSAVCMIPQFCNEPTCDLDILIITFDYQRIFEVTKGVISAGESTSLYCIREGAMKTVKCGTRGNLLPDLSLVPCDKGLTIGDTTNDTVSSCKRCFLRGTQECVGVFNSKGFRIGAKCICRPPYMMATCYRTPDLCTPNYCNKQGQCKTVVDEVTCSCFLGFRGEHCELNLTQIDEGRMSYAAVAGATIGASGMFTRVLKTIVLIATSTLKDGEDIQTTHQSLRVISQATASFTVAFFGDPTLMGTAQAPCRFYFIAIHFAYLAAMIQWLSESWNVNQILYCVHLNEWERLWKGKNHISSSIAWRMYGTAIFLTVYLGLVYANGWNDLAAPWTCVGVISQSSLFVWFPVFCLVFWLVLNSLVIMEANLLIKSRRPGLELLINRHIEMELGFEAGKDIRKCLRNHVLPTFGLIMLVIQYILLILSSDYKENIFWGRMTVCWSLLYSLFCFFQEMYTCPTDLGQFIELLQRFLPTRFAPAYNPETLWTTDEVKAKYGMKKEERNVEYQDFLTRNQNLYLHHKWDIRLNNLLKSRNTITISAALERVYAEEMEEIRRGNGSLNLKKKIQQSFAVYTTTIPLIDPRTPSGKSSTHLELVTLASEAEDGGVKLAKFFIVPGFDIFQPEIPDLEEMQENLRNPIRQRENQRRKQHIRRLNAQIEREEYKIIRQEAHAQAVFINSAIHFHHYGNHVAR